MLGRRNHTTGINGFDRANDLLDVDYKFKLKYYSFIQNTGGQEL